MNDRDGYQVEDIEALPIYEFGDSDNRTPSEFYRVDDVTPLLHELVRFRLRFPLTAGRLFCAEYTTEAQIEGV